MVNQTNIDCPTPIKTTNAPQSSSLRRGSFIARAEGGLEFIHHLFQNWEF